MPINCNDRMIVPKEPRAAGRLAVVDRTPMLDACEAIVLFDKPLLYRAERSSRPARQRRGDF